MIVGLDWEVALACVLAIYVGATVQGSIGIGMGMIAAPILALADSAFIPATVVIAVLPLTFSVAWADRVRIQPRGVGVALLGRLPGAAIGAVVAALLSDELLSVLVASSVIAAVIISLTTHRFDPTATHLATAGFASGFTGTTTGIGGPPMALTYQHADPVVMRASLSAFFAAGAVMSIVALTVAGEVGTQQMELAALLLPGVIAGVATARIAGDRLDERFVRPAVLAICTLSAIALTARVIL